MKADLRISKVRWDGGDLLSNAIRTVSLSSWVIWAALSAPLSTERNGRGSVKEELSEVEKHRTVQPTWCFKGHIVQLYNVKLQLLAVWLFLITTIPHPNTQLGKLIRHQHQQLKYCQRVWEPDRYLLQFKQKETQRIRFRLRDSRIDNGIKRFDSSSTLERFSQNHLSRLTPRLHIARYLQNK